MMLVLSTITAGLVVATLLPLWHNPHWLVRGLDFPRLQLAVLAGLLLTLQAALLDPARPLALALMVATVLCLCWQLWWIIPYTPVWRTEVRATSESAPDRRIRVLMANVLMPNRDAARLLDLVADRKPDVVLTLESDGWWQEQLDSLLPEYPHSVRCPLDNLYGMHLYSKLDLRDAEISYLVEDDKPSIHTLVILRSGHAVRLHCLHPAPPSPTENPESAERDAELVIVGRSVAQSDHPVIVTGDLNDVAWSSTTRLFRKISGLLDPRVGRGMFNTFHARYPFARWPLDHLFHSSDFTLRSIERLPPIGSDHFSLLTELSLTASPVDEQHGLDSDEDDESRARSIAEEQRVDAQDVPRPGE